MSERIPGAGRGLRWVSGDTWIATKGMTAADYAESHGFPRESEVAIPGSWEISERPVEGEGVGAVVSADPDFDASRGSDVPTPPPAGVRLPAPIMIDDPQGSTERIDVVRLAIGFDEGTLSDEELVQWAQYLADSGMEYSTGTFARFVAAMRESGEIT